MHAFLDLYDSLVWVSVADGRRSQAYAVQCALSGDKRKSDDEQYRHSVKPYKCRFSSETNKHASNSSYSYTAAVVLVATAELCGWVGQGLPNRWVWLTGMWAWLKRAKPVPSRTRPNAHTPSFDLASDRLVLGNVTAYYSGVKSDEASMAAYEADPNFKSRYRETERRAFGDASMEVAEQQDTERVRNAVIYFVRRPFSTAITSARFGGRY